MAAVDEGGSPAQPQTATASARTWLWIPFALVVVGSIAVGITAVPILAGLLFPPVIEQAPFTTLRTHVNPAHGVDEWAYVVYGDSCAVFRHFEEQGGACRVTAGEATCGAGDASPPEGAVIDFVCHGSIDFSSFRMNWRADLRGTDLVVHRAVDWTGQSRTVTPDGG